MVLFMNEFSYELIALAMLLILEYIYLVDYQRLPTRQTKLFMAFLHASIVSDVINIGFSHIKSTKHLIPSGLCNVYVMFYFLLMISLFPTFAIYMYEIVAREEWKHASLKKRLMYVPILILAVFFCINLYHPFMYWFEGTTFVTTEWIIIPRMMPFAYLCSSFQWLKKINSRSNSFESLWSMSHAIRL